MASAESGDIFSIRKPSGERVYTFPFSSQSKSCPSLSCERIYLRFSINKSFLSERVWYKSLFLISIQASNSFRVYFRRLSLIVEVVQKSSGKNKGTLQIVCNRSDLTKRNSLGDWLRAFLNSFRKVSTFLSSVFPFFITDKRSEEPTRASIVVK